MSRRKANFPLSPSLVISLAPREIGIYYASSRRCSLARHFLPGAVDVESSSPRCTRAHTHTGLGHRCTCVRQAARMDTRPRDPVSRCPRPNGTQPTDLLRLSARGASIDTHARMYICSYSLPVYMPRRGAPPRAPERAGTRCRWC